MSLSDWQKNGWLKPHQTQQVEIKRLFDVIERDLRVSGDRKMDADWRFVAAYNAALQSANVALHASGFEAAKGGGAHHYTIESLKLTIAASAELVDELQAFMSKRGGAVYEMTGIATETEIDGLRKLAIELRDRARAWLEKTHPSLASAASKSPPKRK